MFDHHVFHHGSWLCDWQVFLFDFCEQFLAQLHVLSRFFSVSSTTRCGLLRTYFSSVYIKNHIAVYACHSAPPNGKRSRRIVVFGNQYRLNPITVILSNHVSTYVSCARCNERCRLQWHICPVWWFTTWRQLFAFSSTWFDNLNRRSITSLTRNATLQVVNQAPGDLLQFRCQILIYQFQFQYLKFRFGMLGFQFWSCYHHSSTITRVSTPGYYQIITRASSLGCHHSGTDTMVSSPISHRLDIITRISPPEYHHLGVTTRVPTPGYHHI